MKIGLIGNQNSGKTTLFNKLTGMNQKIGNWPGVTIEKKSGIIKGSNDELIDLPGVYSLSPYSIEEEVAREFILKENLDLIINIIDTTSLERSLYLTTQLLELDSNMIVVLNMMDRLEKKGIEINIPKLEEKLGVRIVAISALNKTGLEELKSAIKLDNIKKDVRIFDFLIEDEITKITLDNKDNHKRFRAIKIIDKDVYFTNSCSENQKVVDNLEKIYEIDSEELIANQRYNFIEKIKKECLVQKEIKNTFSSKLDKIFLNRFLALPIFIIIIFFIYFLSVGVVGTYTSGEISMWITNFSMWLQDNLLSWGASDWIVSLICDGICQGVGAILSFIPQLLILFLCISLLETTGYMSRIAFIFDSLFRKIGLSGKTLIPFIVGSGCSVPGIMSTKTIEDHDERKMAVVLTPFIPCSAKLPIIALFAGAFFPQTRGLISAFLYFLAIVTIILSAIVMKKFIFKKQASTYISELPEYRAPSLKYIGRDVYEKVISFIKRAGTIILLCSIVIWFLLSFSWSFEYGVDIEKSILASIGNFFAWIFYPMLGEYSWAATVSAFQGLIAKEQVIGSMAVINGLSGDVMDHNLIFSAEGAFSFFTSGTAFAFIVFNLFCAPCFGAIAAMRRELGSKKEMMYAILFQTSLAWVIATIIGLISRLFL